MAFVMLFSCIMAQHTRAEGISLITNGDGSTDDVSCFFSGMGGEITHAQMDGNTFKVDISAGSENMWDAQFGIKALQKIPAGTFVRFKTMVKCTDSRECDIQAHRDALGNYVHWNYLGYQFTTKANEWIEYEWTGTVPAEADDCDVICINFGTLPEAATIWFKDIEWEITTPEEINEGIIATFFGTSRNIAYPNGQFEYSTQLTIDGQVYLAMKPRAAENAAYDARVPLFLTWQQTQLRPNKTYYMTFDVMGTPSEHKQYIFTIGSDGVNTTIPFNITDKWQRVTKEITTGESQTIQEIDLLFGASEGLVYITNIFIYDALDNPNLPEIPTVDLTRIPAVVTPAIPIEIGATQQIAAVIQPETAADAPLVWTSANEEIATVNEHGSVTGISKGLTSISVKSEIAEWGSSIPVYVHDAEPTPVAVSSITIDPMIVDNAKTGDRINLTATVLPENADDKTVTWSSSNESVATISTDGVVDIVAPGTAVITATANDGSGVKGVCLISGLSSLDDVVYTSTADKKDVYTVDGKLIMRSATRDGLNTLAPGIYLVGDMKIAIR